MQYLDFKYILIFIIIIQRLGISQESNSFGDTVATEEIEILSNRIKMSPLVSPNKVSVYDETFLNSLNGNRLSDALSFADGIFIKDYGFNSGLKTISLNLTQAEHTLLLLNGVKLNSPQNAQFDLSLLSLDNISRIEVSKGGSSSLYGSEAVGGVINIITKDRENNENFNIDIISEMGSYSYKKITSKLFQRITQIPNINYHLSYTFESSSNNYEYYYFDGITRAIKDRQNADYKLHNFNFFFNSELKKSNLKIFSAYAHSDRGVPGIELGYPPSNSRQSDRNLISSFTLLKAINPSINFTSSLSYKYSFLKYFDPSTQGLVYELNSFHKLNSYFNVGDFKYIHSKDSELNIGYEINYNTISSSEMENGNSIQTAIFLAGKYESSKFVFSKTSFYPSLRYDYYSNISKNVFTPKIGLNIVPLSKISFSIKSSLGTNYRVPTFNELYWNGLGNKNLKPENSLCFDAGIYYKFNFISSNELEVSYSRILTVDRIIWKPDSYNLWRPINIGEVKSECIDISIKSKIDLLENLQMGFNLNYNFGTSLKRNEDYPNDPSFNKQLIYLPQEFVKSSIILNYLPKTKIIKFVSLRTFYTFSGKRYKNFENTDFAPYYDLIDANMSIGFSTFKSEVIIKIIVNNITNKDYQIISGYPMALRNYKFQIGFKY